MEFLWQTDWQRMFMPEMSLVEILVRGVLTYLAVCLLLRVVLKRQAGKVAMSDLLVVALAAGVCRNPLIRDAYSITDGVLVVTTVLASSYVLDWASYRFKWVHRLMHAAPVMLIQNGTILAHNLENELMTELQLRAKLRKHGVRSVSDVAEAWMEGDGNVTVIRKADMVSVAKVHGGDWHLRSRMRESHS